MRAPEGIRALNLSFGLRISLMLDGTRRLPLPLLTCRRGLPTTRAITDLSNGFLRVPAAAGATPHRSRLLRDWPSLSPSNACSDAHEDAASLDANYAIEGAEAVRV